MLKDLVECPVPNPGTVSVGSTFNVGAAPLGYTGFLAGFGAGVPCYFFLSDGAGLTICGVGTPVASTPESFTVTEIIWNFQTGSIAPATFSSACVLWNTLPSMRTPLIANSPLAGLRNLIINGNPTINQRSYASGVATVAANQYTLDRWKVVVSGQNLSYTDAANVRTCTAPAGGVEQVIEGLSIQSGIYTLSWVGTATALVGGGAVANGGQVTLTGGSGTTIRFTGGTFALAQLEPGPLKTLFEMRPVMLETALCQRYYWFCGDFYNSNAYGPGVATTFHSIYFPVKMRAIPTAVISYSGLTNAVTGAPRILATGAETTYTNSTGALNVYGVSITYTSFNAEL